MSQEYTIEQGKPSSEPFLVRDEDGRRIACFHSRYDAELFATMMGCDSCKQDVSDHTRVRGHGDNVTEQLLKTGHWTNPDSMLNRLDHPNF